MKIKSLVTLAVMALAGMTINASAEEGPLFQIKKKHEDPINIDLSAHEFETVTFETENPWNDASATFTGIKVETLVEDLFPEYNKEDVAITMVASDGYAVGVPYARIVERGAAIVYQANGETIDITEKGPYFLAWPDTDLETIDHASKSYWVWHLKSFTVPW